MQQFLYRGSVCHGPTPIWTAGDVFGHCTASGAWLKTQVHGFVQAQLPKWPLSCLQRQVLHLYRGALRLAHQRNPPDRAEVLRYTRQEFERQAQCQQAVPTSPVGCSG